MSHTEQMREALRKIAHECDVGEHTAIARAALTAPAAEPEAMGDDLLFRLADDHSESSAGPVGQASDFWVFEQQSLRDFSKALNDALQSTRLRGGVPEGWQFRVLSPGSITVQTESGYTCTLWKSGHGGVEALAYQMADMLRNLTAAPQAPALDALDAGVVGWIETITGRVCAPDDAHRRKFPMCYRALTYADTAPPASQELLLKLAAIAAECSDPDTTDALDQLIAATPASQEQAQQPSTSGWIESAGNVTPKLDWSDADMQQPSGGEVVAWRWMPSQVFPQWVYSDDPARVAEAKRFMGEGGVQPLTLATPKPEPLPLPRLTVSDSHMESLIEAAIQGHASTRDAMRWLVRQLATKPEPMTAEQIVAIAATPCAIPGSYVYSLVRAVEAHHGITSTSTSTKEQR